MNLNEKIGARRKELALQASNSSAIPFVNISNNSAEQKDSKSEVERDLNNPPQGNVSSSVSASFANESANVIWTCMYCGNDCESEPDIASDYCWNCGKVSSIGGPQTKYKNPAKSTSSEPVFEVGLGEKIQQRREELQKEEEIKLIEAANTAKRKQVELDRFESQIDDLSSKVLSRIPIITYINIALWILIDFKLLATEWYNQSSKAFWVLLISALIPFAFYRAHSKCKNIVVREIMNKEVIVTDPHGHRYYSLVYSLVVFSAITWVL